MYLGFVVILVCQVDDGIGVRNVEMAGYPLRPGLTSLVSIVFNIL